MSTSRQRATRGGALKRRDLFRLAAAAAAAGTLPRWAWSNTLNQVDLFPLGTASGAPTPDGFVLWTRLLRGPVRGTQQADTQGAGAPLIGPLTVHWEVASDEGFRRIVARGEAVALPELGHAVHVELRGLASDRWYFYRFMHGDAVTPTARTRTSPNLEGMASRLRFAFASCQRYEQGYYAGYRDLVNQDLDLMVFLGDYIYEVAVPATATTPLPRRHSLPVARTLADYRDRYALYKTDPLLQAAHRHCPWLVTWDDHEVENDYSGTAGVGPQTPFMARRNAGYQAFYENMPLPASVLTQGVSGLSQSGGLRIYGRHSWGRLADFHMLDGRQYRAPQACRVPGKDPSSTVSPATCPELRAPNRTVLGDEQEQWLRQGLMSDARPNGTRWSVLAQQNIFAQRNTRVLPDESYNNNTWDSYPAARQRLLDTLRDANPRNAVFIGGDIHQNYVCRVPANYMDPNSPTIGSEFCGTSLSSHSSTTLATAQQIMERNPHVLLARPDQRGYSVVEVTPHRWTTTLRGVEQVTNPDSAVSTQAVYVVEDGRPGPERIA